MAMTHAMQKLYVGLKYSGDRRTDTTDCITFPTYAVSVYCDCLILSFMLLYMLVLLTSVRPYSQRTNIHKLNNTLPTTRIKVEHEN